MLVALQQQLAEKKATLVAIAAEHASSLQKAQQDKAALEQRLAAAEKAVASWSAAEAGVELAHHTLCSEKR